MNPNARSEKLSASDALRLEHDDIRAQLVSATLESGRIAQAAKRVAQLCLPHFEVEEKHVFPLFDLLHHLAFEDTDHAMMAAALPAIAHFKARYADLRRDHEWIITAIATLIGAARKERNREIADLGYRLWLHERMEDVVIYPTIILIGRRVQEAHIAPDARQTGTSCVRAAQAAPDGESFLSR